MENKSTSVFYSGLIWGLIIGFAGIIYSVILYMFNQYLNQNLGYAGMLISIVLLILGIRSFRDKIRGGILPFGPAFSFSFTALVVSGLIGTLFAYILWTVIDPDILTKMSEMQVEKMLEKGRSEDEIEQAMGYTSGFMKPGIMAVMGFVVSVFMGTIISLIVAAIFKREEA